MTTIRALLATLTLAVVFVPAGAVAQDASPQAPTIERGVVYGDVDGGQLLLDVHRPPANDSARPAVLLFHGGGLVFGDRAWMDDWAQHLGEAGYVAFSIGYRLFGDDSRNVWPAQLDDAQRAVRWVRANADDYGVDPERICSFGHSAGGLLAAQLGVRDTRDNADPALAEYSSRITCVVDIAGVSDPTISPPDPNDTTFPDILGGTPQEVPDAYDDYSVISHIDADTVPFLALHGTHDTILSVEHSRRLADALQAAGIEVVYGEFPDIDHLDWVWANGGTWILPFLAAHLHPES